MRSWTFSSLVAGLLALSVLAAAVELPTGPNTLTSAPITFTDAGLASVDAAAGQEVAPSRVLPAQTVRSTRVPVRLSSRSPIPEDVPAGTPFAGEFIVLYKEYVSDVEVAAHTTRAAAIEMTTAAMQAGEFFLAAGSDISDHVKVLSMNHAPVGVPCQAVIKVPAEISAERVKSALGEGSDVKAVVPNRVVRIAQAIPEGGCTPAHYASAVAARPAAGLSWAGCSGEGVGLAAFGERCGAALDKFRWTGLYAYDKATGAMLPSCLALRAAEADPARQAELFGACGTAPTRLQGLPTHACSEESAVMPMSDACVEAASLASHSVQLSASLCPASGGAHTTVTLTGTPCGPDGSLVQWETLAAPACAASIARASLDPKQAADWVGACGVPPAQIAGLPTRVCHAAAAHTADVRRQRALRRPPQAPVAEEPSSPEATAVTPAAALPRVALKAGESTLTWGMNRIGAVAAGKVIDASAAFASGMKVVVMDTGVEKTHPDLNVVEFVDFYDDVGAADHGIDGHGHGTHVGGIIGAKNQGAGVAGVVPGMPILAIKVLGRDGSGSLDNVYKGYAEIVARQNKGEKIVAINLSLGSPVMDADSLKVDCDWSRKLTSYGTAMVAAAGNDGGELLTGTMPAACPDSLSVTSIAADDSPSYFSNLAELTSPQNIRDKTVAAPGSAIYSTYAGGSYMTLSGTSMATPHATGVVAACFLANDCKLGSPSLGGVIPKIQAAAKAAGCTNAKKCGPSWGSSKFYGNAINVRGWSA